MPEAQFIATKSFQFGAGIKRVDSVITVSPEFVKAEMEKGKHSKTGHWISGLLNHCEPLDDFTAELVGEEKKQPVISDEQQAEEIAAIKKEMTDLGIPYDNRWKLPTLKMMLTKGKKEKGL